MNAASDQPLQGKNSSRSSQAAHYENVVCPRCGADDTDDEYSLVVSHIVRCRRCQLCYVNPRVSHVELAAKLQAWAEQDVVDEARLSIAFSEASMDYFGRFEQAIRRFAELPGRRLLDVGCSTGAFLKVARDAGWQAEGLELGHASARYVEEVIGSPVYQKSIYDFSSSDENFDAVAMIEVIEHLEAPGKALQNIHRWLKPGGILLVTTPNYNSLYRRLFGKRWWVINCEDEHIVFYSLETLEAHLQEQGYDVLYHRIQGLDVMGMLREWRKRGKQDRTENALDGYYEAREGKGRIKAQLRRFGMLGLVKRVFRLLEAAYVIRWLPLYALGEQLVVVARRRID